MHLLSSVAARAPPGRNNDNHTNEVIEVDSEGIFWVVNDASIEWAVAAHNSIRSVNTQILLVVIPFDDHVGRIEDLIRDDPRARLFDDDEMLRECDAVGAAMGSPNVISQHMYRKFAVFGGPLEHFIYMDTDIIVRQDPQNLLDHHRRSGAEISFYDTEPACTLFSGATRTSWEESGRAGFNAGFFISQRDTMSLPLVRAVAGLIGPSSADLETAEQSFLNIAIQERGIAAALLPTHLGAEKSSFATTWRDRPLPSPQRLPFLHWAGVPHPAPRMPQRSCWLSHRLSGQPWWRRSFHALWTSRARPGAQRLKHAIGPRFTRSARRDSASGEPG